MHHRARHAPRRSWTAAGVALIVATGVVSSACGLGDRARLEARITSAPALAEGRVLAGTITIESRLMKVPAGASAVGVGFGGASKGALPVEGVSLGVAGTDFVLDLATSRATLLRSQATGTGTESPPEPAVVFDDLVLYGRRGGVPADDARPWVRLDLDDVEDTAGELDPLDGTAVNALFALHPAVLTDLVAGTLTGSIKPRGDSVLEVGTTHYDVNVSLRKALQDTRRARYPERRREAVERLLRLLGVVGDLHPGEVWLDGEGRLRRFRVELRQEPLRKVEFRMIVQVDVPPTPTNDGADLFHTPAVDEVLGVDSVLRFTSTVVATGNVGNGGNADDAADAADATAADTAPPAEPTP